MSSVFLWSCLLSTSCLCSSSSWLHAPPLIVCIRVSLAPPPVLVVVAMYLSCRSLSVQAVMGETAWKANRITPPPQNKHGGVENAHAGTLVSPLLLSGCKDKWRTHLRGITWLHPCQTVVNLKASCLEARGGSPRILMAHWGVSG